MNVKRGQSAETVHLKPAVAVRLSRYRVSFLSSLCGGRAGRVGR